MGAAGEAPAQLRSVRAVAVRCWPLLLGNVVEWYEFSVYGFMAPQLREAFFQGSSVAVWLCFAITFVSRPLGGLVFGYIGDTLGRKVALNISIAGMLLATVGQGLLPTNRAGPVLGSLGLVLLVACRFVQGLSAGGEISTIISYMAEVAPQSSMGMVTTFVALTGNVAFLLANTIAAVVHGCLGTEDMLAWGWRIPFIFALLPGSVAVWGRRRCPESEAFLREQEARQQLAARGGGFYVKAAEGKAPEPGSYNVMAIVREHALGMAVAVGATATPSLVMYVAGVWMMAHVEKLGADEQMVLYGGIAFRIVSCLLLPVGGWLTDVFGVGLMTFSGALVTLIVSVPAYALLRNCLQNDVVILLVFAFPWAIANSLINPCLFCADLFPTAVRATALGLSWNVGVCFWGGFGGALAQGSLSLSKYGPGIFLSFSGAVTGLVILGALRLQRLGYMQLGHVRAVPYWGRDTRTVVDELERRPSNSTSLGNRSHEEMNVSEEEESGYGAQVRGKDDSTGLFPVAATLGRPKCQAQEAGAPCTP